MARFLYYVPNLPTKPGRAKLEELGLGYLRVVGTVTQVADGPGSLPGIVFAGPGTDTRSQYSPDSQTWRQMKPREVWIGYENGCLPGPDDLAAPKQLTGHNVELSDGREWLIPIARTWTEEDGDIRYAVQLPRQVDVDDNGDWAPGEVSRKYAALWKHAERHMEGLSYSELNDAALCAIQTNYSVGKYEQAILGLLEDDTAAATAAALNDLPGYQEIVKKKALTSTKSTA